jgi:periplasmic divalent cation tolerance protein
MEKSDSFEIVFITTDSFDNARNIARILVSEKIAACCSIIHNILSVYEWQQTVNESMEYMLLVKTSTSRLDKLEKRVLEIHPYDTPEIISAKMSQLNNNYLDWMRKVLTV